MRFKTTTTKVSEMLVKAPFVALPFNPRIAYGVHILRETNYLTRDLKYFLLLCKKMPESHEELINEIVKEMRKICYLIGDDEVLVDVIKKYKYPPSANNLNHYSVRRGE